MFAVYSLVENDAFGVGVPVKDHPSKIPVAGSGTRKSPGVQDSPKVQTRKKTSTKLVPF